MALLGCLLWLKLDLLSDSIGTEPLGNLLTFERLLVKVLPLWLWTCGLSPGKGWLQQKKYGATVDSEILIQVLYGLLA